MISHFNPERKQRLWSWKTLLALLLNPHSGIHVCSPWEIHDITHLPAHESQPLPQLGEFSSLSLYLSFSLSFQLPVFQASWWTIGQPLEWLVIKQKKTSSKENLTSENQFWCSRGVKSTHWYPIFYFSNKFTQTTGANMQKTLPYIFPAVHPLLTSFNLVS